MLQGAGLNQISNILAFIFGAYGAPGHPNHLLKGIGLMRPFTGLSSLAKIENFV